jgi:predicted nucleic acid-binding protein
LTAPFLIDTNVVSELTRPKPNANVLAFLNSNPDLYLSVIVLHELEYGIRCAPRPDRRMRLEAFALALSGQFAGRIFDIDAQIAETAGRMRALRKNAGRILAELDAFIAATALVKGIALATRNIKDFAELGVELRNPFDP